MSESEGESVLEVVGTCALAVVGVVVIMTFIAGLATMAWKGDRFLSSADTNHMVIVQPDLADEMLTVCVDGTKKRPLNCMPVSALRQAARAYAQRPR